MSTPGFLEMQLDPLISYGTKGGLTYSTMVVSNPSRIETRYPQRSRGYWNFEISLNDKTKVKMNAISAFFAAVQGKSWGWRFRNWREYQCTNEPIPGFAGGTTMQLTRLRKLTTGGVQETVLIKKPDLLIPITLQRNTGSGFLPFPSAGNWTLDVTTGLVLFNANQTGNTFTWTGQHDMAARFDTDLMDATQSDFDQFDWESLQIMEIIV